MEKSESIPAVSAASLWPGEGLYGLLSQVSGVPTTLFVDSQGKQVGTAYVGANDLDGWKTIADELLEGLEA